MHEVPFSFTREPSSHLWSSLHPCAMRFSLLQRTHLCYISLSSLPLAFQLYSSLSSSTSASLSLLFFSLPFLVFHNQLPQVSSLDGIACHVFPCWSDQRLLVKVFKRYVAHTHYAVLVLLPTPLITIGNYCCTFPLDIFLENVNNVGPYEHLARPIIHWQLLTSNFPLFASLSSWPHMVCIISRLHCFISYYLNCNYNYFGSLPVYMPIQRSIV